VAVPLNQAIAKAVLWQYLSANQVRRLEMSANQVRRLEIVATREALAKKTTDQNKQFMPR
jgi:hypothetical protein